MNLKRWFAWLCLALMLVAEAMLFHANRQREAAQQQMREAQIQTAQTQRELAGLKHSTAGQQAEEISRLRKQNEIYTNRLAEAQARLARLQEVFGQTTQSLATARAALQLQQDRLERLQTENKLVADAGLIIIRRNACINNLRAIDAAKQQWALENNATMDAVPTVKDLLPYLKDGVFPVCPAGGKYAIHSVAALPTCSVPGHVLPP